MLGLTMITSSLKKQSGISMLVLTVILLLSGTLIVMFAANHSIMQSKITSNQYRSQEAFEAAQAGLEFGISYLIQNNAAITGSPSGGFIPTYTSTNTTNVAMSNGSHFSIGYSNPTANNYNLILITSTGTSDDGTATRVVSQQVQYGSTLLSPGTFTLVSIGQMSLSGNTTVTNTNTNNTIEAGSSVAGSGNFKTVTSSGTNSTSGNFGSDITQNVASLANTSDADLFSDYFGMTEAQFQSKAVHTYNNSSNYATTLNGLSGTTVWINQSSGSANFSGNATIGTPSSPVLIVVNGNLNISGNFTLYGFMFVLGASSATTNLSGNITINGGMATTDNISASGNFTLTYDPSVLNNVQTANSYYAKVPGSWKDF
jgi:Tfp pilus assembly protein PilX